nr:10018_t:CDS:2 [Entrophospora candida]
MDTFLWLFLLSTSMFLGSLLAGSIPLVFQMSEDRLKIISAFGVGLLVGTSLIVIIPEGIETLYNVPSYYQIEANKDNFFSNVPPEDKRSNDNKKRSSSILDNLNFDSSSFSSNWGKRDVSKLPDIKLPENENHHYIGMALISGFVMMFLIDQIDTSHVHSHGHHGKANVISLTDLRSISNPNNVDPTIGLIIHAAADGIALGASANEPTLETIVFLAIMLHKAPSAFGLSTILLREGYTRRQIRRHLATFCLAAPLSSLCTFALIQQSSKLDPIGMQWWTAMLLLFSGGTFLYVAMHVMQDVTNGHHAKEGIGSIGGGGHKNKLTKLHVGVMLMGMVLPLFLEFEHGHGQ